MTRRALLVVGGWLLVCVLLCVVCGFENSLQKAALCRRRKLKNEVLLIF
jgi:hypothetical protein